MAISCGDTGRCSIGSRAWVSIVWPPMPDSDFSVGTISPVVGSELTLFRVGHVPEVDVGNHHTDDLTGDRMAALMISVPQLTAGALPLQIVQ